MVEGARLESVYTPKVYRGFESRPLRNKVKEKRDEKPQGSCRSEAKTTADFSQGNPALSATKCQL